MARPLGLLIPDGWYHVFHRGTERRAIYRDDRDRSHFLDLLNRGQRLGICSQPLRSSESGSIERM